MSAYLSQLDSSSDDFVRYQKWRISTLASNEGALFRISTAEEGPSRVGFQVEFKIVRGVLSRAGFD